MKLFSIVLAAGQGKRMKTKKHKVLHEICGKPMIERVVGIIERLRANRQIVVVGYGAESVQAYLGDRVEFAMQSEQLGTGHAVLQAKEQLENEEGVTIVAYGDTPLLREETLCRMLEMHREQGAAATIMTAVVKDPTGLGRIIRTEDGYVTGIVEQKDCTPEQALIPEINAGTYCFDNRKLFAALAQVTNHNSQKEYYLTDVIGILKNQGDKIIGCISDDPTEAMGVNDRVQLAEAERLLRERIVRGHMLNGVTIVDPAQTYIEDGVEIGIDTTLLPGCVLKGATKIGEDCVIGPYTELADTKVADLVEIKQSILHQATVGSHSSVGPFAYLRPGAKIGEHVKIGDFVEIKNATIGEGTKVSHLTYVGDAVVGKNVNFGCGSITVNYDGFNKQLTEVGDDAFIGSNVNLIAPVKIGNAAYVVAGSTITNDVSENDVAIARERQVNKAGYAEKLRERFRAKKAQD
ncbi:bifunctional UDP-N-acetylglucosamine diphosphorylase/glucosamine-1-phosphate N-acetyltransferase GlmU [Paenibacillus sp. MBLB4367]|uniref:bifunctional UDP-N-acetylglucosamine diphosphorylase/glucosamine-1-phosphate N-acetyltransferase GlmU n=1 Tax=Paenibacillus sp. MBLB4367 TaxID=3384767 RepID=UPI003908326E